MVVSGNSARADFSGRHLLLQFLCGFYPLLAFGASWIGLVSGTEASLLQRITFCQDSHSCFLLMFCSQEERGRGGWWHERAGSLGRNHVTTTVTGWQKTLITYSGCKCVVLRRKHKQNVFIFNFNPKQWELHCCFLRSMVCTKERERSRGNCLWFRRLNCCIKRSLQNQNIQLLDCAAATAGSSSADFGPYWIEVSWKKNTLSF